MGARVLKECTFHCWLNFSFKSWYIITYQVHMVTCSTLLSIWGHWGQKALLHRAHWLPVKKETAIKQLSELRLL